MTNYLRFVFILLYFLSAQISFGQFTYISPVPDSKMHHREAGIILRTGDFVDVSSLQPDLFSLSGSISGEHPVKVKLGADDKSILVRPSEIFSAGETVAVNIKTGITNSDGRVIHGISFQFQIR